MRVALLAPGSSVHTVRWATGLADRGLDVHLITAHPWTGEPEARVAVHRLPFPAPWAYGLACPATRSVLRRVDPDVLNTHYATGYGLLGRCSGFVPNVLSVWGSDVYEFPYRSPVHRRLLRANLAAATVIGSTSECMARQVRRIHGHPSIRVTPFGVDVDVFRPVPGARPGRGLVVGTVKTLSGKYGIDTLISAFARVAADSAVTPGLTLEIAGDGPDRGALQALCHRLGVAGRVRFLGSVPHHEVPSVLRRMDIFVALSRCDSESFGVAVVEASSCGLPVVVSDAEGLSEVVVDGTTGLVVPRDNPEIAARALHALVASPDLRRRLGDAGRSRVLERYSWERSLDCMIDAYRVAMELAHRRPVP